MVKKGESVRVAKLPLEEGKEIAFDVVLYAEEKKMKVGTPYLEDVEVKGKIAEIGRGEKLIVYKYKKRKRESVKKGHRQDYTEVEITSIGPKETIPAVTFRKTGARPAKAKASQPRTTKAKTTVKK